MAAPSASSIEYHTLSNFTFNNGTTLPHVNLAYKIFNPQNTKIAIVHTCFRGRIDTTLTHADGALRGYKIIVLALFGNGESSSPSNTADFPDTLDYQDCVKAQHAFLTQELGVDGVDVMLGFSMGGQITYHWITTHPTFVKNAVIVCSSARTSRHNYQFLEGPKSALQAAKSEKEGIRAFGKAYSGWLTSAEWFDEKRYEDLGFENQEQWDSMATEKGYEGWTGADLLAMLGMWQRGDIARCAAAANGNLEEALKAIEARVLLMPCETDQYFRPYVNKREAKSLRHARVEIVPTVWGHVGGGGACKEDVKWMGDRIGEFLRE